MLHVNRKYTHFGLKDVYLKVNSMVAVSAKVIVYNVSWFNHRDRLIAEDTIAIKQQEINNWRAL